jgi:23S rRNA (cytosine1962-C5)-methyltransferase
MSIDHIFARAFERRRDLFALPDTDCFRLFNSDGDGLEGLVLDYYSGYILMQVYSVRLLDGIFQMVRSLESAAKRLPTEIRGILYKKRIKDREDNFESEAVSGEGPKGSFVVKQNGVSAAVDLVNGQNTGIFLDMREIRKQLEDYYKGRTIANLFSYTGLFSAHALLCGAVSAVNIDLSKQALARARDNYRLNGLATDSRDFVRGDALAELRRLTRKGAEFSMIFFDPPTFARNRKASFSVKRDYNRALSTIADAAPGGLAFTAINAVSVSEEDFMAMHPAHWDRLFFANEPSDFPYIDRPYLKTALWRIKNS